jgi:hypothetical protein
VLAYENRVFRHPNFQPTLVLISTNYVPIVKPIMPHCTEKSEHNCQVPRLRRWVSQDWNPAMCFPPRFEFQVCISVDWMYQGLCAEGKKEQTMAWTFISLDLHDQLN